ncbi:hypothetical protein [Mucilaginibacter terrae]|uniref:Uncharacterized protein n=1 Tax=Mucilaginibacter terrae TaxID=1955052 RepID=A0ABU3GZE1_9SPHI|nr:hypothetical protein [Mucilaginibacter terrae]MDT3405132.1 hypothetical protein [Mucilaginibacter terrae]
MKIFDKEKPVLPGQSLRYLGKGFPGYVAGQPYMVFVAPHHGSQYLVEYNALRVVVNRRYVKVVG